MYRSRLRLNKVCTWLEPTMPITIQCSSCGFILYQGKDPKSVDDVLKKWGYRCPCCLSVLKPKIHGYKIEVIDDKKLEPQDTELSTADIGESS